MVSVFGSWPWAVIFMYRSALLKSRVELSMVVAKTRVVFKAPTVKAVDGALRFVMGVPSQWYHWKVAMPLAGDQRSEVT